MMMAKQCVSTVVPRLRFPEFRKGAAWQKSTLGDASEMRAGKFVAAADIADEPADGWFPCYGGNGLRGYTRSFTHEGKYSLIGRQGALCGNVRLFDGAFHATEHALVVTPESGVDTEWLFYALGLLELNRYSIGQAQPGLSVQVLEKVSIAIPRDLEEQQKIADCLTSLDEVIAAQGRKVEALKAHKRGLMQQLFPREGETRPRLRFPEFRNAPEWEKKQLAELGEIITGKTPSTADPGLWGGDVLFITPTDIDEDGKYQDASQRTVFATLGLKVLPAGSIAYTCIASIGKLAITVRPSITNQQINSVVTRQGVDNEFVYYALVHLTPWIRSIPATSTLPIINKTEFSRIEIWVPTDSFEQKAIADCLSSLDTQITAESSQLAALKTHKQGLMQQLFPAPETANA